MKIYYTLLISVSVMLMVSCVSEKDSYMSDLSAFTEEVVLYSESYSSNELSVAMEQYAAYREEASLYEGEFTEEDLAELEQNFRVLNEKLAEGYIDDRVRAIEGYLEEAAHLVEDLF